MSPAEGNNSIAWVMVGFLVAVYLAGCWLCGRKPTRKQIIEYSAGVLVVLGAVTGPLDLAVRDRSFSLYIVQQMLLVFVTPVLLLGGTPDWMVRPFLTNRFVEPVARKLLSPLVAFLTFSATFAIIHYPPVCDIICHVRPEFGDLREVLLLVGLILWFPILSPLPEYPRLSYPLQILYLYLLMIPMTAVAAPITMAHSVLYMFYMGGIHPLGLSPHADQVLGGLIMWIGQGVYIMFVYTSIFIEWSRREDREVPAFNRRVPNLKGLSTQGRQA